MPQCPTTILDISNHVSFSPTSFISIYGTLAVLKIF
jgi:hypothetical protein